MNTPAQNGQQDRCGPPRGPTGAGQRPTVAQPQPASAGAQDQAAAPGPSGSRLTVGLDVAAEIEAHAHDWLPRTSYPELFYARGRVARRPQIASSVAGLIPQPDREGWVPDDPQVHQLTAKVAADLVVMGKFDVRERIKLRAAYGERGLTVAAQPRSQTGVDGIARVVQAYEVVRIHAPHLMAPVLGWGRLPCGLPYVIERWLSGTPLHSSQALTEASPRILAGLADLHRGHGIRRVRLSQPWPWLAERWAQTCRTGMVPSGLGSWVTRLIGQDRMLRHSWIHGDLVASNVLDTRDGLVLIDWEHAAEAPIMNDGAKLHLFSSDPEATMRQVLEQFGQRGHGAVRSRAVRWATSSYSPAEELALAHAQLISLYPRRSAALAGHPRASTYELQVQRQLKRLEQVRDAC